MLPLFDYGEVNIHRDVSADAAEFSNSVTTFSGLIF